MGKTTVAHALHSQLSAKDLRHGLIEGDNLDMAHPPPWVHGVAEKNLAAMWKNSREHRRSQVGRNLCEHAMSRMKDNGAKIVEIGTGGDPFHAPARALYESLGCKQIPVAVYFKEL
ncbi:MAG: hypothetical protein JWO49_1354 [Arthrobacter sp.]|nr:hypothetical protein [Arthrobacter sp.]